MNSEVSVSLTSHYLKTDITALKFTQKYLLAGAGNILHVYDILTFQPVLKKKIFSYYRIHGVHPCDECSVIALHGNRSISVISSPDLNCCELGCWDFDGWVWDTKWFTQQDIIVLTTSNTVTIWNYDTKLFKKQARCPVKCSLYSGLILVEGDRLSDIVVLSGTCFKQIIVWFPFNNETGEIVTHILNGHEGAVFSIFVNEKLNLISSTSDDRTVRIWKLSSANESLWIDKSDRWRHSDIDLKFTIYGHISRVWKSMILDTGMIITISEDSQLRIWDSCGKPLQQWEAHQGSSVWCLDVDKKLSFVVTGGKDGGISSWPLPPIAEGSVIFRSFITSNDYQLIDRAKRFVPRRLVFTKQKRLVIATEDGIILWSDHSSNYRSLNVIFVDDRLSSYCLLKASLQRDFICLTSITGTVIILKESQNGEKDIIKIFDEQLCNGKIFSVHWLEHNHLITCVEDGKLELWKLSCDYALKYSLLKIAQFSLPACKERWLTSALQYGSYILVGDRDGSVHLYSLSNPLIENDYVTPSNTFRRVHRKLGVSSICRFTDGKICSTGRDGYIRYWIIRDDGQLDCLSADKLTVKWPVHIFNTETYGLLVLGFNEVNLELWSIGERRQILKCNCGGGHRSWDFIFDDKIYFAYTKMMTVGTFEVSLDHLIKPPFSTGFHAREINNLICLDNRVLISASEDTTLRFSLLLDGYLNDLNHFAVLRSHISSVRTISCINVDGSYYLVSAGGRAQLKVWKIDLKYDAFYRIANADHCYQELASHLLKGEDKVSRPWRINQPKGELEPRYMDVEIVKHQTDCHKLVIISACSDGILRIFTFDTNTNEIRIDCNRHYGEHCILKICTLTVESRFIVITMTTDGVATFWDATNLIFDDTEAVCTNELEVFYRIMLHQSGINSCDSIVHDDTLVLCTGGDDTDLRLTIFNVNSHMQPALIQEEKVSQAHGSQITGLKLTDQLIISTGLDQRIKIWRWSVGNYTLTKLELIYEYRTCVPDIHGITTWTCQGKTALCVYGAGTEVFELSVVFSDKRSKKNEKNEM